MTYTIRVYNPINRNWFDWAKGIKSKKEAEDLAKEAKPFLELRVEVREE